MKIAQKVLNNLEKSTAYGKSGRQHQGRKQLPAAQPTIFHGIYDDSSDGLTATGNPGYPAYKRPIDVSSTNQSLRSSKPTSAKKIAYEDFASDSDDDASIPSKAHTTSALVKRKGTTAAQRISLSDTDEETSDDEPDLFYLDPPPKKAPAKTHVSPMDLGKKHRQSNYRRHGQDEDEGSNAEGVGVKGTAATDDQEPVRRKIAEKRKAAKAYKSPQVDDNTDEELTTRGDADDYAAKRKAPAKEPTGKNTPVNYLIK